MDIVTIDLETYYTKEYSLSKMTTEAYVRSPQFQVIGVGIKINNNPTDWYSGEGVGRFLKSLDYSNKAILCHNTVFDGAILSWHYGIKPKLWLDTLSMARPIHNISVGGSLSALATHYKLGTKGDEVVNAIGKRREDFTLEEISRYADYCVNDVELTYALFNKLKRGFPVSELLCIDQTLRMYTEPVIELDVPLLQQHLLEVQDKKSSLMQEVNCTVQDLMSNDKFASILQQLGVTPPRKTSLKTGKDAWAFAKTDKGMTDLLEHPDDRVQGVVTARLGVKSTIEETRTMSLIGVAQRGRLPIMLNYYGAHTGRYSGGDKMNLQNLPARGNNTIRRALKAPDGYTLISSDSSQIEARMVAWVAGQTDLLDAFAEGRDVYSEFASEVYGRTITKTDKVARFVGKTCIAEGTLVLSHKGWKPIETVTTDDLLWDGGEWVCHQGLQNNGIKKTLSLCGAYVTPDHQVWSGTKWLDAQLVVQDESILYQTLATAAENLPSQAMFLENEGEYLRSSLNATATYMNTQSITTISKTLRALDVLSVLRKRLVLKDIGYMRKHCQMMLTAQDFLTACRQRLHDAIPQQTGLTHTMVDVGYKYALNGVRTVVRFLNMCRRLKDGITHRSRWTGLMSTAGTSQTTLGLCPEVITYETNEKSLTLRTVYDILNCGSRNRFVILTDAGPVIVHNCILGLGYGMGAEKFRRTLEVGQGGISVSIELNEAERIVRLYRQKNWKIVQLWQRCGSALTGMTQGGTGNIHDLIPYDSSGITLPNKFQIKYPALRQTSNGFEYIADARTYRKYLKEPSSTDKQNEISWTRIYGGKVTENLVQALAAIVIREQMTAIGQHYHVAFQVHDEIIISTRDSDVDNAEQHLVRIMSTPPIWATDLPIACESGKAKNYGDT